MYMMLYVHDVCEHDVRIHVYMMYIHLSLHSPVIYQCVCVCSVFWSVKYRYYLKERAFHGTLVQDEEAEVGVMFV